MQVTHTSAHVTHAVLGGEDTIAMRMSDDPAFLALYYENLYSDIKLAVVREILSNAWDAHIEANKTDMPIEVLFLENKMVVKDFGTGIPKEKMGDIYGVLGGSTKKKDKRTTGGFGLGCKSPFAYTDNFEVTSTNQGVKTIYRLSKSSAQMQGKPGITPVVSIPCEESGLTVTVPLRQADISKMKALVRRVAANGDMRVSLNGSPLSTIGLSTKEGSFVITRRELHENDSLFNIRYGSVIYPISRGFGYEKEYDKLRDLLSCLSTWRHSDPFIVLQAPPSSLSLVPSREALLMSDDTVATVTKLLSDFNQLFSETYEKVLKEELVKAVDTQVAINNHAALLSMKSPPEFKNKEGARYWKDSTLVDGIDVHSMEEVAMFILSNNFPGHNDEDFLYRLDRLKEHSAWDFPMIHGLQKAIRFGYNIRGAKEVSFWFRQYVVKPCLRICESNDLVFSRILLANKDIANGVMPLSKISFAGWTNYEIIHLLQKQVVITHGANKLLNTMKSAYGRYKTCGSLNNTFLVYRAPRNPKTIKRAIEAFEAKGYKVINLCEQEEIKTKDKEVRPKRKGYPTLYKAYSGGYFYQDDAVNAAEEDRTEKPLAYTKLYAHSDRYSDKAKLPNIPSKAVCRLAVKHWGDQIAVIISDPQAKKLEKAGAKPLKKFIGDQIVDLVKNDKEVRRYIANTPDKAKRTYSSARYIPVEIFWDYPELSKAVGLNFDLDKDQRLVIEIVKGIHEREVLKNYISDEHGLDLKALEAIPEDPAVKELAAKLESSVVMKLINFTEAASIIRKGSEEEKNKVIDLITTAFKG